MNHPREVWVVGRNFAGVPGHRSGSNGEQGARFERDWLAALQRLWCPDGSSHQGLRWLGHGIVVAGYPPHDSPLPLQCEGLPNGVFLAQVQILSLSIREAERVLNVKLPGENRNLIVVLCTT